MFLKRIGIKWKLLLSFSVVILFLAVVAGVGVMQINTISLHSSEVYEKNIRPLETLAKIKTEFAELRRIISANVAFMPYWDEAQTQTGIKNAEDQYALLKAAGKAHLSRLTEVNESQQTYDTANVLLNSMYEDYAPVIEQINTALKAGDTETVMEGMEKGKQVSGTINEELDTLFSETMTMAAKNLEQVMAVSQSSIIVLIIVGVIAAVVSVILAFCIGGSLSKRIIELRHVSTELAKGNLDLSLRDNSQDELGDLTRDLNSVVDSVKSVMSGLGVFAAAFISGKIDAKLDTSSYQGAYKTIAEDINNIFSVNVNETLTFITCVTEFSKGDFSAEMAKLPGDKIVMNNSLDGIRNQLKSVTHDISALVNAAASGRLSDRADTGQYEGDWAKLMDSLNRLMDAVVTPITEIRGALTQVAVGNFSKKVTGNYEGDFLLIKDAINDMTANMDSYIGEIADTLNALANDDLNQSIKREYVGRFSTIKDALNNIIDKFNNVISDITTASSQVAAGARQISESSMTLAQGATEQASAVEELNATMDTISQATSKNAESARAAENLSERSELNATQGDKEMKNMLVSMQGIKESSNSISKIIKVIDDIAFQTNLLALNAAVEAARAGAQGKGFAVVAEEVRSLAGRSQNAAKETAQLIEESINRVNEGTRMADSTAQALKTIVEDVAGVAGIISTIVSASEEQAAAIDQVVDGLLQITEVVQNNSATSEESASASQQLSSQSEMLKSLVDVFTLKKSAR